MPGNLAVIRKQPIYILLDVSESMWRRPPGRRSALDVLMPLMDALILELDNEPHINKTVWICALAFSDDVQVLRPMAPVHPGLGIKPPRKGVETDYAKALRFVVERHPEDVGKIKAYAHGIGYDVRIAEPLVFFVTDGAAYANRRLQEDSEWLPHRERLVSQPIGARIATIGLSRARTDTLWRVATGRDGGDRNAFIATPGTSHEDLAGSIKQGIESSIRLSARAGEMIMSVPQGMRRVSWTAS